MGHMMETWRDPAQWVITGGSGRSHPVFPIVREFPVPVLRPSPILELPCLRILKDRNN